MRRKTFDLLASLGGILVVAMLIVAGGLATWGYNFSNNSVHTQLAQQQITFPALGSTALASPKIGPYLNQYAGQPLTTGDQAEAYADHFIAVHLSEMPYNGVYANVSAASMAAPTNATLKAEVQTVFQGTTLRGLLLEAYAFSVFATIALWAAIASFLMAFLMALLVGFGFWHARRTPETAEILTHHTPTPEPSIAS
jgi:predicted lipid-binding transport protein (Tim44 family)